MGILRADRVSGLGGANAINGSVFFGTSDDNAKCRGLIVSNTSDLDIGAGNFTIEYWFNTSQTGATAYAGVGVATWEYTNNSSNTAFNIYHYSKGIRIFNRISSGFTLLYDVANLWSTDTWHHFAWIREGTGSNENKVYIDGTQMSSAFTNAADYTTGQDWLIGGNNYSGFPEYGFSGHLSNVRVSNTARYTANFTAPTTRFEKDADTIILACQSPGNVLQEATGKTITGGSTQGNDYGLPVASRFVPDKGEDHGTTFADNTKFDTLSYMVPPGGTTTQSNRGRGLFSGGDANPAVKDDISYLQIQSQGNAADFGNLTARRFGIGGAASSIRGVFAGGYWPNNKNIIDYVTIATTSNATDFGDSTAKRHELAASSNNIRAIFAGGYTPSHIVTIDYITIATTGNATDFGDNNWGKRNMTGAQSPTRGFMIGGRNNTPSPSTAREEIEYVTFSTTGNATDFGNLSQARGRSASVSSSTRAVIIGGETPTAVNTIDYITMATAGNATDFGDSLTVLSNSNNGCSNSTRGAYHVAFISPAKVNNLQYITIASTGNSLDFGDLNYSTTRTTACSDSHGGIS